MIRDKLPQLSARAKHSLGVAGAAAAGGMASVGHFLSITLPTIPYAREASVTVGAVTAAGGVAHLALRDHSPDLAVVEVDGMITDDSDAVSHIEDADDDDADVLLVVLNTPGGKIVPSDDIRRAVANFDGPTVGYAASLCASGGYLIASECDRIITHPESRVGSIGVISSRPNLSELGEQLGVSYERYVAGERKDAGSLLKEPTEEDRETIQGLVDGLMDSFVETVADNRPLSEEEIRALEARVFLSDEALDLGLIDETMSLEEAKKSILMRWTDQDDPEEATIKEYGSITLDDIVSGSVATVAKAAGRGAGEALASRQNMNVEYR